MRILAAISIALCACTYDASYGDCAVHCTTDTGCPDDHCPLRQDEKTVKIAGVAWSTF